MKEGVIRQLQVLEIKLNNFLSPTQDYMVKVKYCLEELTCHQQQPLCLGLHLGSFAVLLVRAAVEGLTGLMNDCLLQVHLIGQNL